MIGEYVKKIYYHWKILLKDRTFVISLLVGFLVLIGAYYVSFALSFYHETMAVDYVSVGDFILNDIPTYNLRLLDVWGFLAILVSIVAYTFFYKPEIAPFAMKTFGILILVRAFFIMMTHVGPPNDALLVKDIFQKGGHLSKLFFENDLFFSGHTAVPFLAFLVFKESKVFKWVMLIGSILMAATVLLMHVHYSIDVFAAFFITYGIYSISNKIFRDLNIRFKRRVTLLGWNSLQKRIKNLKEKRRKKKNLKGDVVGIPEPEEIN